MKIVEAIPATIEKFETKSKYVRLTIDTQESVTKETAANLYDLKDKPGWLFFAPAEKFKELKHKVEKLKPEDLPDIQLEEGEKSPSQRQRAALYVYWEQRAIKDDFELFYRRWMERSINKIKEALL